ncbi:tRNA guanosine(34) transglycosylase Tgt [Candidatus Wolfebacteria bacterium]|nr:tRNA guanosine(34) transglycosylase Tgt [Candidatus Wolfebacteria bacterium]
MENFQIKNTYKKARTGILKTSHGNIKTPNLAIVATHGQIKLLNKTEHKRANPDFIISNTFHLFVNNKVKEIKNAGGLHKYFDFKKPIMTDSGGFQVFSLGWGKVHGIGKIKKSFAINKEKSDLKRQVEISENGVNFLFNKKQYELTPEKSIKIQKKMGADIIFVFDECTSPFHSYTYNKKAIALTHRWAIRCLEEFNKKRDVTNFDQMLFGIVQGGIYEELRKKSSKFIGSLPFGGFGIGGSFGEKQMKQILNWSLSGLPDNKPRHLLGIGKISDIFIAVKQGIDLFDCVIPTREARHGVLYTKMGKLAIKKGIFSKDKKLIEKGCGCWVCQNKITRQEIHHLFKKDKLDSSRIKAQRLAIIHNIYFFKNLFIEIREAIFKKRLDKLEKEYCNYF